MSGQFISYYTSILGVSVLTFYLLDVSDRIKYFLGELQSRQHQHGLDIQVTLNFWIHCDLINFGDILFWKTFSVVWFITIWIGVWYFYVRLYSSHPVIDFYTSFVTIWPKCLKTIEVIGSISIFSFYIKLNLLSFTGSGLESWPCVDVMGQYLGLRGSGSPHWLCL